MNTLFRPRCALVLVFVLGGCLLPELAHAQASASDLPSISSVLWKWMPLLLSGFALNVVMSVLAMTIGTVGGVMMGIAQLSPNRLIALLSWGATHFFRNSPWLVLLFFIMFLVPFRISLLGYEIGFPDWIKATIGLSIPIVANISEVTRGAIQSIPRGQWESATALGFSRHKVFLLVILPQCVRRMLPPWMNWYAILLMATVLSSILGVAEVMTIAERISNAEARQDLLIPLYGLIMGMFFVFCYPIAQFSRYLEARTEIKERTSTSQ